MLVRYVFDKSYHILVLARNDSNTVPLHSRRKCSAWCTGGSKMDIGAGALYEHLSYF